MKPNDGYPYLKDCKFDHRAIGLEPLLNPFLDKDSSPRASMFGNQQPQAMILSGCEFPHIFTGYEHQFGKYEFDPAELPCNAEILNIIPKWNNNMHNSIGDTPSWVIIFRNEDNNHVDYIELRKFFKGTDGYGYENKIQNRHKLRVNEPCPAGMRFATSTAHLGDGSLYALGTNANTVYISGEENIEDAIPISRRLANKLTTTAFKTIVVNIEPDFYPLNVYGSSEEHKFIPNIGEYVNRDGILCAFRKVRGFSFVADTLTNNSQEVSPHDNMFYAPAGAEVVDLDVHVNLNNMPDDDLFKQLQPYIEQEKLFHQKVLSTYKDAVMKKGLVSTPKFNTLVTYAMGKLASMGNIYNTKTPKKYASLVSKDRYIKHAQLIITLKYERKVGPGFKLAGRFGNKGVISKIIPDEMMPRDEYGNFADAHFDATSVIGRMNIGQLYESQINCVSRVVASRVLDMAKTDLKGAVQYYIDYLTDVFPNYGKLVSKRALLSRDDMEDTIDMIEKYGICINIPCSLGTMIPEKMIELKEKWGLPDTPITFQHEDERDGTIHTFCTEDTTSIGEMYIYLLCKLPTPSAAGVTYTSQFGSAIKASDEAKYRHAISPTPIRFPGEDEVRVLLMSLKDSSEIVRLMSLQGNSPKGVSTLVDTILTAEDPANINRVPITTAELVENAKVINIMYHMLATAGITFRPMSKAEAKEQGYVEDES